MNNIKMGYINGELSLNKPLTDELCKSFEENYPNSSWSIDDEKDIIISYSEENYEPHKDLQQIIVEFLEPNGYILNGEVSIEEDSAYTDRIFEWYLIVKNNEVLVTNQLEREEDLIIDKLKNTDSPVEINNEISKFLYRKGYKKLSSFLNDLSQ